jgi:rubrerythrin
MNNRYKMRHKEEWNLETVKVKFLREIEVMLQDEEIDEDERLTSFSICECMKCHWKFIGECERHGYGGYTSQGVQIPNFCPMCGGKISDELAE